VGDIVKKWFRFQIVGITIIIMIFLVSGCNSTGTDEHLMLTPSDIENLQMQPIYDVYKNGSHINISAEIQWFIRELAEEHGYCEKMIFGLILEEANDNDELWEGFRGANSFWLRSIGAIAPYRLTDNYQYRNLADPFDNLLTVVELWNYVRARYDLDVNTDRDKIQLLYWHHTGMDPSRVVLWDFATRVLGFADELVIRDPI
jgi:hypothetical protein